VRVLLAIVAFGLFVSGVTIWPWEWELERILGLTSEVPVLHAVVEGILADMRDLRSRDSFVLYGLDWLAYAHLVLTALFVMAMKDPVRNILVVRFGLLCCLTVPLLAAICVPLRGLPWWWVFIDSSFAICAVPLWLALRELKRLESAG